MTRVVSSAEHDLRSPAIYLGLDIGGTKCTALVGTSTGEVLDRISFASDAQRGPDAMIADLVSSADRLRDRCEQPPIAVGVTVGGPLDTHQGVVLDPPNLPGWDQVPLRDRLQDALELPVCVEHDAVACALAEYRWGAAQGARSVAYLTCGTGFGMGLIIDGKPYHGSGGYSGEIGHARFAQDGPEAFGKRGSVEAYCAGASLPKLAAWRFPSRWSASPPDGPALAELSNGGDTDARVVLDGWARAVGQVAAALADTLFPEVIVLGSLARYLGPGIEQTVRTVFAEEAHPHAVQRCRLSQAALGERLQDCSALAAATCLTSGVGTPGMWDRAVVGRGKP